MIRNFKTVELERWLWLLTAEPKSSILNHSAHIRQLPASHLWLHHQGIWLLRVLVHMRYTIHIRKNETNLKKIVETKIIAAALTVLKG